MKKTSFNLFAVTIALLFIQACNNSHNGKYSLIGDFSPQKKEYLKLSEVLGKDFKKIELQESYEYPIGRINKVIKRWNNFFILSDDRQIHYYNDEGKLVSVLAKFGRGPTEYNRIEDFDVFYEEGELFLWLSDYSKIKEYIYNGEWKLTNEIVFPFVVNKFYRISKNRVLLMCGRNEKTLVLTDISGNIIKEYLDKEIPFLTLKSVQFIPIDTSYVLFPLGMSNSFVKYDIKNEEFSIGNYSNSEDFLTKDELVSLYNEKGYDFFTDLKTKTYIKNIRSFGDHFLVDYYSREDKILAIVDSTGNSHHIKIFPNRSYTDDIVNNENNSYLTTFFLTFSDDGILFIEEPKAIDSIYYFIEFFYNENSIK